MSFWGLVLEPKKSYTQRGVEQPFHVSMAALDLQNSDPNEQSVSVVCRKRDSDFILCSLSKKSGIYNVPLNLDFEVGGEINFHVLGNSTVHLTGYIIEDMESFEDSDESGEEEEDVDNDVLLKNTKKQLDAIKRKQPDTPQNKSKKSKIEVAEEEEDEDDSDFDMDDSDVEEVEEEEDEDDEEEDDEDEEEEAKPATPAKKDKGKQQPKNPQAANASPKNASKHDQKQKPNQAKGQTPQQPNKAANGAQPQANGARKQVIQGVQVEDLQVGTGPVAKAGKTISVYYVGRLKSNNKQFDATTSGAGFKFRLGRNEVIKGWDIGVQGMKVGGKRRLIVPPKMGYGAKGCGSVIPPNATLQFDVELRHVK